jgi:hypothetical protein
MAAFTAVAASVRTLDGVSAASGVEIDEEGRTAYVVGDDSVFLYVLDVSPGADASKVARKVRITSSRDPAREEGIAKKLKPDFECIVGLPHPSGGKGQVIAAIGSGSKAGMRDGVVVVDPAKDASTEYDARLLMDALRADKRVVGEAKLNLEAATVVGGDKLALCQRGNIAGGFNSVVLMQLADFQAFLQSSRAGAGAAAPPAVPAYSVVHLQLPQMKDEASGRAFNAGVSGASTVVLPAATIGGAAGGGGGGQELILLSASYEGTDNEIDDGPILGSRIAAVPAAILLAAAASSVSAATVPAIDLSTASALLTGAADFGASGAAPLLVKIEGVAPRKVALDATSGDLAIDALAVTDPDGADSQILEVRITVPAAAMRAA